MKLSIKNGHNNLRYNFEKHNWNEYHDMENPDALADSLTTLAKDLLYKKSTEHRIRRFERR